MKKYSMFKKRIMCPHAMALGYGKYGADIGDLVLWRVPLEDGGTTTDTGRVVGRANIDGMGQSYKKPMLAVLCFSWCLDHAYIRHVDPEAVLDVRAPTRHMPRVLFESKLPDAGQLEAMSAYGALGDPYIEKYLDAAGNIVKDWRSRNTWDLLHNPQMEDGMPKYRVTLGGRCYDTYLVEAESPMAAVRKIQGCRDNDPAVEEELLGEISGEQSYENDNIVSIRDTATDDDCTQDVQEQLLRKSGKFVEVLLEAYGYNEDTEFNPQAARVVLSLDFLERVEKVAAAAKAVDGFCIEVLPGHVGVRYPKWYKVADPEEAGFVQGLESELTMEIGNESALEQVRAESPSLLVDHDGEFHWEALGHGTTWTWCTRSLKLADAQAILKKEMQR